MKRARKGGYGYNCGVTLLELMLALVIASILMAVASVNLAPLLQRQQLRSATNDLFSAISLTRSSAIARGTRVLLMPLAGDGTDWSAGWVVFADLNGNQVFDTGDDMIFEQGPVARGIKVSAAFSSPHPPFYLAYNGAGRSCSATNSMAARWGTLSLVLGKQARHIKINMLGRARVCDPDLEPDSCSGAGDG